MSVLTLNNKVIEGREDISEFIVHLTRRNEANDKSAMQNLLNMVTTHEIRAFRPHCLYNEKLKKLPQPTQDFFNVACFTEVPLNQLHLLVRRIEGRQVNLEAYGLVFRKDFIVASGGQPALYINSYGNNLWLRASVDELFEVACSKGITQSPLWRLLPFINAMNEKYDFTWEREWRVTNKLTFNSEDLVCAILPADTDADWKEKFASVGVAVISPGWTYEQTVTQLARQQRRTRTLVEAKAKSNDKADQQGPSVKIDANQAGERQEPSCAP